ncbi:hypothetical protein [Micromonospora sp. NPDC049679]|uniref:hypothetical protein n=1 Tax=Micromonospora sp. NPDC049679 TaxID=3155920 RepID=UPI0033D1EF54
MRLTWRVVRFEAALWRSLFLLLIGRRDGVEAGSRVFSYHRAVTPVWLTLVAVSAVEVVAVHVMTPWASLRLALLVVGVWGLLLLLGLWASYVVRPYVVGDSGVRLRHGTARDLRLRFDELASVAPATVRAWDAGGLGAAVAVDARRLAYVVGGETRIVLTLAAPRTVPAGRGRWAEVDEIHIGADDPDALLAALRSGLTPPVATDLPS